MSEYRGTSLIRKRPPSQDPLKTLDIFLLYGPRRGVFLMSEVPLYLDVAVMRRVVSMGPVVPPGRWEEREVL